MINLVTFHIKPCVLVVTGCGQCVPIFKFVGVLKNCAWVKNVQSWIKNHSGGRAHVDNIKKL